MDHRQGAAELAAGVARRETVGEESAPLSGAGQPIDRVLVRNFRPAWWLPGAHVQTIAGKFLRPREPIPFNRRRIETPDGDFLDLDFGPDPGPDRPLVVILHGLEGSSRRKYVSLLLRELLAHGVAGVALNFRACSGEPNRLPRFYHSGDTGDLRFVLDHLGRRFPGRALGAAGVSLGGNVILRYLGEEGKSAPLAVAATISVPFDLAGCAERLSRGFGGLVYGRYFLRSLKSKVHDKRQLLESELDVERVLQARTLIEYDDALTAPLHGFRDAQDYYARADARRSLADIRVPVLLLHAADDPFLSPGALPEAVVEGNPSLTKAFTRRGGHLGFVEGGGPRTARFWAERQAARFLAAELGALG